MPRPVLDEGKAPGKSEWKLKTVFALPEAKFARRQFPRYLLYPEFVLSFYPEKPGK